MGLWSRSCLLLLLAVVLSVPVAVVHAACTNKEPCDGQPDCRGCDPYAFVPDPTNCQRYYMCDDKENILSGIHECDSGTFFNPSTGKCDANTCTPCSSQCVYSCSASSVPWYISSPNDCQVYYECSSAGTPGDPQYCPDSAPTFDGIQCQTDGTRCCRCLPYCEAGDVGNLIADPLDCRNSYICTTANDNPTNPGTCPKGTNFDPVLQGCSATAPCLTKCTNIVGADGCIELFTCLSVGYFAKCPGQCNSEFYHCTEATGEYMNAETCFTGTVFHPDSHTCVTQDECPY